MSYMDSSVANSLAGHVLDAGEPVPQGGKTFFENMMESYPGIGTSMAFANYRGRNTMLRGAAPSANARLMGGSWGIPRQMVANNNILRPRIWSRYAQSDFLHQTGRAINMDTGKAKYTPHVASITMNAMARGITGTAESAWARKAFGGAEGPNAIGRALQARGMMPGEGEDFFARGATARFAAGAKVGSMSSTGYARHLNKNIASMHDFLTGGKAGYSRHAASNILKNQTQTAQAYMMSGSGVISGRIGGYMAGMEGGASANVVQGRSASALKGMGTALGDKRALGIGAGEKVTTRRAIAATAHAVKATEGGGRLALALRGGRLAVGGAAKVASRFAGPVGVALLAYDAVKLGTYATGHTAKKMGETLEAYAGSTRAGVFGNTFTDNEATMTSRSRGVHAISNSRLNARSVLGNEAAALAGYYG